MTYLIGACTVAVEQAAVVTCFPDGGTLIAVATYDAESSARATSLGYGDGSDAVDAMTRDHDLLHTLLAEARGQDFSPTLHAAAAGRSFDGDDEERIVMLLARLMNQGRAALDLGQRALAHTVG